MRLRKFLLALGLFLAVGIASPLVLLSAQDPPSNQQPAPAQPQPQQQQPPPQVQQPSRPPSSDDEPIIINFENADLYDFINFVVTTLKINYIIDPAVTGKVTIKTDKPIRRGDLIDVFQTILQMNNATMIKGAGDLYQIVPIQKGIKGPLRLYRDFGMPQEESEKPAQPTTTGQAQTQVRTDTAAPSPGTATAPASEEDKRNEFATYIVPIEFLTSSDMANLIKPFVSEQALVIDYAKANLLIITDFKQNVKRVVDIIRALDGKALDGGGIDLIKVKYYSVTDISDSLKKIFATSAGKDANVGITIVPIEHLNAILVVANSARALEEVHRWVDRLDSPSGRSVKTFVYHVQNSIAGNIASILSQLYSEPGGQAGATQMQGQPGQQRTPLGQRMGGAGGGMGGTFGGAFGGGGGFFGGQAGMQGKPFQQLGPRLSGTLAAGAFQLEGQMGGRVKIIVDDLNNSLIIQASDADYEYLLQTIKQLDVLPRQVLIDAKVFRVDLTDNISLGITAELKRRTEALPGTTGSFNTGDPPSGALQLTTLAVINEREILALLSSSRFKSRAKALQAPSVLVLDGHQANITVGAEIPVTTATFGSPTTGQPTNAFLTSIQFRETGTVLLVSPRINASGMVTMEIAQEVSSPAGESLTPTINKASVQTTLTVMDGQTVVIGGVITESRTRSQRRIPLLGDIPILGYLFGSTERNLARSEIIVLITPHVIRNPQEHATVSDEVKASRPEASRLLNDFEREFNKRLKEAQERRRKEAERKAAEAEERNKSPQK